MNKHIRSNRKRQIAFYNGYDSKIQFHAISKMGVGLPEPPCRGRFQTTICCCFLRVMVVSNMGKGSIRSQVSAMETNKTEPLLKCRKSKDVIKTGIGFLSRDKSGGYLIQEESLKNPDVGLSSGLLSRRWPVCRRREHGTGFDTELGNLYSDAKGEIQVEDPQGSEYQSGIQGRNNP